MPFNNYAQLQDEIKSFMWDRADVVAKIPTFITLAESEIRRLLRTAQVNDRKAFSLNGETASIPCGAGAIKAVRLNETSGTGWNDLDYVSPEQFSAIRPETVGTPRFYTIQNERLYFTPSGVAQGEIVFVDPFEPLSATCACNWLLKRHPDIYLCGALKWGKAWLIDSDWDWASPFYSAIDAANADNPRVQTNTRVRADEVAMMGGDHSFNIRTGGFRA